MEKQLTANELRIGNLLKNDGVVVTIDARSIFDIWDDKGLKKYQPIPLTEEWLVKFAFEKYYLEYQIKCENDAYWVRKDFRVAIDNITFIAQKIEVKLKYVHELQNLYFALTGEELTII